MNGETTMLKKLLGRKGRLIANPVFIALVGGILLPFAVIAIAKYTGAHEKLAVWYGTAVFISVVSLFMVISVVLILFNARNFIKSEGLLPAIFSLLFFSFFGWQMLNALPPTVNEIIEERLMGESVSFIEMGFGDRAIDYFGAKDGDCSHVKTPSGEDVFVTKSTYDGKVIMLCGFSVKEETQLFDFLLVTTKEGVKIKMGEWPQSRTLISLRKVKL